MIPGIDFFAPLAVFCFSTLITPGPNNMMVAASGVNFGFARTRPHVLGIVLGHAGMTFIIGAGLGRVFQENPDIHNVMRWLAFAFICWIAWRIATADIGEGGAGKKPMTFFQAVLFQWINPKAVAMAVGATTTFMTGEDGGALIESAWIAGMFLFLGWPCISVWALFGAAIGGFLKRNRLWLRTFNITMALLLVAAMLPTLF